MSFTLVIPGRPAGKGRARHGNGRTFTPRETVLAEQAIRHAWIDAGEPTLGDRPVRLRVKLAVVRPAGHFTSRGTLSAAGRRQPVPARQKPDCDNALKLIMDALNTRAWRDDVQVVDARVYREWDDRPYTSLTAEAA